MRLCNSPIAAMCSQRPEPAVDLTDLDIPAMYSKIIPSPDVHASVNQFRSNLLQPRLSSLVFPTAAASLSVAPPSVAYNPSDLLKAPIPPASYLRSLREHLVNLTPSGHFSLRNPANTKELLPLWALTVWEEASWLAGAQEKWEASCSWVRRLQNTPHPDNRVATALDHLEILGWDSPVTLYGFEGTTNLSLAQFLSDDTVDDEAIDLMSRFLAAKPTLPRDILIADLRLPHFILAQDPTFPPHIRELKERMTHAAALYFPMFYEKYQHWIAFKVDLRRKKVMYGKFDHRSRSLSHRNL